VNDFLNLNDGDKESSLRSSSVGSKAKLQNSNITVTKIGSAHIRKKSSFISSLFGIRSPKNKN
jgi:hypothetical protein